MQKFIKLENEIYQRDGLIVVIRWKNKIRALDEKLVFIQYPYKYKAKRNYTVAEWKKKHFYKYYKFFEIDVLLGDSTIANGRYTLKKVRDSYLAKSNVS